MKPHKHAELIKAWADGAEIECLDEHSGVWAAPGGEAPSWYKNLKYRIKPEEKKPVVRWLWVDENGYIIQRMYSEDEVRHGLIKIESTRTEFPE